MTSVYFLIGKTLGRYEVLEHIGHGGMSEVYKGRQTQLDRMVAIKVLHPFLADEEGFVVRFQREAQLVATLRHPNIVQVYDFDHSQELDIYYMVMEYIDGSTLKERLYDGPISPDEAAGIAAHIADALDYAHQRAMIHRDIKPANIMFVDASQPVLTDFGIAKMLTLSGLTASGAMVGTPAYMAPEVGLGQPGTASSDLYSLGVVLYQMVTGHLPFESDSPMGLVLQHINDEPKPPSQIVPSLPEALEAVILKSMAKTPEARYGSAREMASALRLSMGLELPVVSTPPPPSEAEPSPEASGSAVPADAQEEPRLVKTWPPRASSDVSTGAEAMEYAAPEAGRESGTQRRSGKRVLRWILVLLGILVAAGSTLVATNDGARAVVRKMLPGVVSSVPPTTAVPELEPATEPAPSVTPTPEATATLEPLPSPEEVAGTCQPVVRVSKVVVEPSGPAPPGAALAASVFLRNGGTCAWPAGLQLVYESGITVTGRITMPVQALPAGEVVQLVLPFDAPMDVGEYRSVWVVKDGAGALLQRDVKFTVAVPDIPAWTATPPPVLAGAAPTPQPLAMEPPLLLEWQSDALKLVWSGQVQLAASGGTGAYRFYEGAPDAAAMLADGVLAFQGRYCEDAQVTVWVLSGSEALQWKGRIAFPASEVCP